MEAPLKKGLPPMPARIAALPRDRRGYPVPWFVAWVEGEPDFRLVPPARATEAHNFARCWVCGGPMGVHKAFAIGPMCAINMISSEPPSHLECVQWSVKACPFLLQPNMRRNEKDLPAGARDPAGEMIKRNPGVTLLWVTRTYQVQRERAGLLFRVGAPERVEWWREGRPATLPEVQDSIASGLPLLETAAANEGEAAVAELRRRAAAILPLLPA